MASPLNLTGAYLSGNLGTLESESVDVDVERSTKWTDSMSLREELRDFRLPLDERKELTSDEGDFCRKGTA